MKGNLIQGNILVLKHVICISYGYLCGLGVLCRVPRATRGYTKETKSTRCSSAGIKIDTDSNWIKVLTALAAAEEQTTAHSDTQGWLHVDLTLQHTHDHKPSWRSNKMKLQHDNENVSWGLQLTLYSNGLLRKNAALFLMVELSFGMTLSHIQTNTPTLFHSSSPGVSYNNTVIMCFHLKADHTQTDWSRDQTVCHPRRRLDLLIGL